MLYKVVVGVYTSMGSIAGVTYTQFQQVVVKAIGSQIDVFLKNIKVISVSDSANISNGRFALSVIDANAGNDRMETQYLAIKPL